MEPSALYPRRQLHRRARTNAAFARTGRRLRCGSPAGIRARADAPELAAAGGGGSSTCWSQSAAKPTARSFSASSCRRTSRCGRTPFIGHNIQATRRAFGLDQVEEREISGDTLLTRDDIARNATTLQNVRLWDHQPLLDTFKAIQVIRTYYDFVNGRQRSLSDQRHATAGDAVCPRARFVGASEPDLDQSST